MRWPRTLTIPRSPDFVVGSESDPYLRRWNILPRNRWCGLYLHNFLRSDDERAMHDHQYDNVSVLLWGRYQEVTTRGTFLRSPFRPVFRRAETPHRVVLVEDRPVWSLFFMGPRRREWGFHCPAGWRHWTKFVEQRPGGNQIGPGCE